MAQENVTNTIERTFLMLEFISESNKGLSNADLSRKLKMPKSSASYILRILEKCGYVQREKNGKYRIGLKLMSLVGGAVSHLDIREIAKPILADFLKKSRLHEVHLAVLDNGRAVYIEKAEAENSFIKMDIWVGHRLPVHTTAIGKALVSNLPEDEILHILELRGMEKKTKKSIAVPQKFLREIERVRRYGFALDDEENSLGVRCLAAPIFDASGKIIAALGTSGVIMSIDETKLPKIVELLKSSATEISKQMGYTGKQKASQQLQKIG